MVKGTYPHRRRCYPTNSLFSEISADMYIDNLYPRKRIIKKSYQLQYADTLRY